MPPFQRVVWSPVEVEWLSKNKNLPVSQLTQALAKSTTAVKRKLGELDGKTSKVKTKKKQVSKIGRRKDCDNLFFRSTWEANVYRVFKLLKTSLNIDHVELEPTTFSFAPFGILKGTVAYTPDMKVVFTNGSHIWIEVKGFLRRQDMTKIKRFIKYYPEESKLLQAITGSEKVKSTVFFNKLGVHIFDFYNNMKQAYKDLIPNWED